MSLQTETWAGEITARSVTGVGDTFRVQIRVSARGPEAAKELGFGSMVSGALVKCNPPMDRVDAMDVFADANYRGARTARTARHSWSRPTERSIMGDVIKKICTQSRKELLPLQVQARAALPSKREAATPPPSGRFATEPALSTSAKAFVAQIGAFANAPAARARLDQLGKLPTGLRQLVETHTTGGRVFFRSSIGPFGSSDAARLFCRVRGINRCWTRPVD